MAFMVSEQITINQIFAKCIETTFGSEFQMATDVSECEQLQEMEVSGCNVMKQTEAAVWTEEEPHCWGDSSSIQAELQLTYRSKSCCLTQ